VRYSQRWSSIRVSEPEIHGTRKFVPENKDVQESAGAASGA
jgi:hypothetical protein